MFCVLLTGMHLTIAYQELIVKIEQLTKGLFYAVQASVVILYFPALPYTIMRYSIFDMGKDSYYLFSMCWFVTD